MRDTIISLVDKTLAGAAVEVEIARLASLSRVDYDRQRKAEAKKLGIKLATLDREVADLRAQQKPAHNFLPHWNVEPWPEEVNGAALLDDLRQQFARYVVLPAHADTALALWVLHTWVFGYFDITPYLSITSPTKRCGKTVLMTLLYWLSCRGKKTDSMSRPAIYRSVDGEKPTLVLDEVGWVLDPKDDRQGILCGGFERNGYAEVCEGEGAAITTRLFSTYCPKAFGLIGKLTATLTDRSIRIPMHRKRRTEKVERLRRRDNDEFAKLRQQCLRWANDNATALAKAPPAADERLNDRALDFWEPLFIIADLAGGKWPKAAREAALTLSGDGEDDSTNISLLRDVHWLFVGKPELQEDGTAKDEYPPPDKLFSKTIVENSTTSLRARGRAGTMGGGSSRRTWPGNSKHSGLPRRPCASARKRRKATMQQSSRAPSRPISQPRPFLLRARIWTFQPSHRHNPITTGITCAKACRHTLVM
jgi:putative DNA primase/helicase